MASASELIRKHRDAIGANGSTEAPVPASVADTPEGVRENVIVEPVRLPKKGKIRFVLFDPTTRRRIIRDKKPPLDGWFRDTKYKVNCKLDGGLMWNGGTEAWIDVSRGIQIHYPGMPGWVGIDGKYSYNENMRKKWEQIQTSKAGDILKWAKLAVVLTAITLGALILSVIVLAGQVGAG